MMQVHFPAADGFTLTGTHRIARHGRAAVLIAGATGVPHRYYEAFAKDLALHGLSTLTFDYRGVGDSLPRDEARGRPPVRRHVRHMEAQLHQWGELDLEGALRYLRAEHPHVPLLLLGHSVGAQLAGMAPSSVELAGLVFVASGSGYWGLWNGAEKLFMFANWHLLTPGLAGLLGFLPMRAFGQGEDLPKGVALEWARWGRQPEYFQDYLQLAHHRERYQSLRAPLLTYSFTDDFYAPGPAVEWLLSAYPSLAERQHHRLSPADLGASRVGHFGFFRPERRHTLWAQTRAWLLAKAAEAQSEKSNVVELDAVRPDAAAPPARAAKA